MNNQNIPIVFVPQRNPRIDYSSAMEYGSLHYIFDHGDYNHASQLYVDKLHSTLKENFQSGDYLLLVGDPVLIGLCFSAMSQMTNGREVNCLKWDKAKNAYYPIKLINLNIEMES